MSSSIQAYIAVLISVIIESYRIISTHGEKEDVSPAVTYLIAGLLFFSVVLLSGDYSVLNIFSLAAIYVSCRGTIYSPILNVARGKYIWYQDQKPNKPLDKWMLNNNVKPQLICVASAVACSLSTFLYEKFIN